MNIQEEINSRVAGYLASDKFSGQLDNTIEAMVNDAVKSMFSYGEIRDAVRKGFAEKIAVDLKQIDFPHVNQIVTDLVKKKCYAAFQGPLLEKMAKELDDMFQPAPKEITLQGIVDIWKEDLGDECSCEGVEDILVEVERGEYDRDGSGRVKIWNGGKKKDTKSYLSSTERAIEPDLELYVHADGRIGLIHDLKQDTRNSLATNTYGKEAKIFMMYCAGTIIKNFKDEDGGDIDTSVGRQH